jgi:hypothetical protein
MRTFALNEATIIPILLSSQQRAELLATMDAEEGTNLPVTNQYHAVAEACTASPEEIRTVVETLLTDKMYRLIKPFIFHANTPEDVLWWLYELDDLVDFVVALGHRSGPQALLERIAEEHQMREAITTLALSYYGTAEASDQAFANFIRRYREDYMLRYNLERSSKLSPQKRELARAVLAEASLRRR